jgi:hypothetical protein
MLPDEEPLRIEGATTSIQRRGPAATMGWSALALFLMSLTLCFIVPAEVLKQGLGGALAMGMLTSFGISLLALVVRVFRRRRPTTVTVDAAGLALDRGGSVWRVPLSKIAEGSLSPRKREVELHLANADIVRATVPTVEDGQRLLAAAGVDAARRTLRTRLGETWFLDFFTVLFGPAVTFKIALSVGMMTPLAGPVTLALFLLLSVGLFQVVREMLGPARLVIGADGIIVRQSFSTRFFPHEKIGAVEVAPERVRLRLRDGSMVVARARHLGEEQRAELETRIADARRAWASGDADAPALAWLDRNGRSPAAWRAALLGTLDRAEGYREQAVSREDLARVLESPAAPAERRVGAAMALAAAARPEDHARIRIAAEACADVRVRVALEKAASGDLDDDALEEAVAEERAARMGG